MPTGKRSHGRITSGNMRPHKTARFGYDEDMLDDDGSDTGMCMNERPFVSTSPTYHNLNGYSSLQYQDMKVAQVIAWPTSLAVIRNQIQYNLTPQEGLQLPEHVLQLVSSHNLRPSSRDAVNSMRPNLPYLHLGFIPFLNMQIFVFIPNLRFGNSYAHDPGHLHDSLLARWTDTVFLPSITNSDPRVPSSWRVANLYKRSPAWYNEDNAPFPGYKMFDSQQGQFFSGVWERVLELSMRTPEFQHPFLLLYSDGEYPQKFYGSSPDEAMHEFEKAWNQNIDSTHLPEDNLMIDFDHQNPLEIRDLPMR